MALLRAFQLCTRSGATIGVHEAGTGERAVFAIGGISGSSFADCAIRPVLEDAADHGARCVLMDIAGSGSSASTPAVTMDAWLSDVEQVFEERVKVPAIWTGASMGAWLMLIAHRGHPDRFLSMCALAPALDLDQQPAGPQLIASRELLASMAAHHVLAAPFALGAPLHVIAGARDEVTPLAAVRRFAQASRGAACTGEFLPDGDHGVAKLRPAAAMQLYQRWLRAQLGAPL